VGICAPLCQLSEKRRAVKNEYLFKILIALAGVMPVALAMIGMHHCCITG
jgi:hypothetical protein